MNHQVAKVADAEVAAFSPEADSKSSFQLLMNPASFAAVQTIADNLASSSAGRKFSNKGDCFAITLDALSSGLDPFKVAAEAHMTQGGQVGYSSKVVNAIVITRAPIRKRPEFEYLGDWTRILGKIKEMKSEKGGKYYIPDWKEADEQGLGVIVRMHLKNEDKPRELEVLLTQCWPRFSTQWATDPKQQISYAAVRKMARLYTPDVLLGIFAAEELEGDEGLTPAPRAMGAAEVVDDKPKGLSKEDLAAWRAAAAKGVQAAKEHWVKMGEEKRGRATEAQKVEVRAIADKADKERTVDTGATTSETKTESTETKPPADETAPAAAETNTGQAETSGQPPAGNGTDDFVADMDRADAAAAAATAGKGGKGSK